MNRLRAFLERRRQNAERRVLDAMAVGEWHYGLDLWRTTRLRSGRLYPALDRLMAKGWIEDTWDRSDPAAKYGRRLYRLSTGGSRTVTGGERS